MNETKILEHVALMTRLNEQGVRAETTKQTRKALADQYGVRIPVNQTPLNERESWTLNSAAKVWNIDYHALLIAANNGTLTTFRPPSRRGTRSWRRVTRKAMEEFIAQFEEAVFLLFMRLLDDHPVVFVIVMVVITFLVFNFLLSLGGVA